MPTSQAFALLLRGCLQSVPEEDGLGEPLTEPWWNPTSGPHPGCQACKHFRWRFHPQPFSGSPETTSMAGQHSGLMKPRRVTQGSAGLGSLYLTNGLVAGTRGRGGGGGRNVLRSSETGGGH